jgi:hypothetical protein
MTSSRVASPPSPPPADPPRRPFQSALDRAARVRGEAAPAARRTGLLPLALALAPAVDPPRPCADPPAVAVTPAAAADGPERVAAAIESIALRDRTSLELRFERGLTVRVEAVGPGVALSVERGAAAAQPVDAALLAGAVRARGVPVARAELRGGGARQQGRRPGAR